MAWKTISSKRVYKNKWLEVTEDKIKTGTGKVLTYGIVRKKPFALVIPWDGKYFTLVGQYRYAVGEFSWEFPQGHLEQSSIIETARKELREETGLQAGRIKEIAKFNLAPGLTSQVCHAYLATGLTKGETDFEESEIDSGMKVKKAALAKFQKMIADGEIKDGPTLAAFAIAYMLGVFEK